METLKIIEFVAYSSAYIMCVFFAGYSFGTLRRMNRRMENMSQVLHRIFMCVLGDHIKNQVDTLNSLKESLKKCVEEDDFEEAENLKREIDACSDVVMRTLKDFKELFGEDKVKLVMTNK